jgi:hypothetical protein
VSLDPRVGAAALWSLTQLNVATGDTLMRLVQYPVAPPSTRPHPVLVNL